MTVRHTTPRYEIRIKRYTHKILKHQSQSGRKLQMKFILASCIDLLSEYKLVSMRGGFLLSRREAVFVDERALSQSEGWNTIFVESEETVRILKAYSEKSGIDKAHIVDHLVRLVRDLKMLSSDRKGKVRLREAIENRNEPGQIEQDLDELEVRKDGELLVGATHTFTCAQGAILSEVGHFDCPQDGKLESIEEGCLDYCDDLVMKVKRDFVIPDGCMINYHVQLRLGLGRSEGTLRDEAMSRGWKVYLESLSGNR